LQDQTRDLATKARGKRTRFAPKEKRIRNTKGATEKNERPAQQMRKRKSKWITA